MSLLAVATKGLRGVPRWIVILFGLGLLVRLALMVLYSPAAIQNPDITSYINLAPFADTRQPSGIYIFVEPFEMLGSFTLLVLAQHLLGLLAAWLVLLAVRRLGGGWLVAGAAASVPLFGSNQLYLEHALLTETLFTTLVAAALLAVLYVNGSQSSRSALAAGVLSGASLCTRSIGLVVIVVAVLGALMLATGSIRLRLVRAAATALGATAVVGVYMLGVALTHDGQSGIGQWGGWYTYARAAPFADCRDFTPPAGTEGLCEETTPAARSGPSWYMFDPQSPARRLFGGAPNGDDLLERFGRAAITSQPSAYARVVARDFLRYFDDDFDIERGVGFGGGYGTIALDRRDLGSERFVAEALSVSGFDEISTPTVRANQVIGLYAAVFELDGQLLLLLIAFSITGVALSTSRVRVGASLYAIASAALLAVPVLTIIYNARYAIPAHILLAVPAAMGVQAVANRMRDRPGERSAAATVAYDKPHRSG